MNALTITQTAQHLAGYTHEISVDQQLARLVKLGKIARERGDVEQMEVLKAQYKELKAKL
jgi:hypothetical protein